MKIFKLLCLGLGLIQSGMAMNLDPKLQNNQGVPGNKLQNQAALLEKPQNQDDDVNSKTQTHFTPTEDAALTMAVNAYGTYNWKLIASQVPGRTPRQCRDRWNNYLSSNVENRPWTEEENTLLIQRVTEQGQVNWKGFEKFFPDRTATEIKAHYFILRNSSVNIAIQKEARNARNNYVTKIKQGKTPEGVFLTNIINEAKNSSLVKIFPDSGDYASIFNNQFQQLPLEKWKLAYWTCKVLGESAYDDLRMLLFCGFPKTKISPIAISNNEIANILKNLPRDDLMVLANKVKWLSQFKNDSDPNFRFLLQKAQEFDQTNQQNFQLSDADSLHVSLIPLNRDDFGNLNFNPENQQNPQLFVTLANSPSLNRDDFDNLNFNPENQQDPQPNAAPTDPLTGRINGSPQKQDNLTENNGIVLSSGLNTDSYIEYLNHLFEINNHS